MNIPHRLEIDYVARPRQRRAPGIAVLAAALVVAGMLVTHYREVKLELGQIESRQGLLSADKRPAPTVSRESLDEEVKNAEKVLRQLALPWSAIIESVESAATDDVALLQLQPDAQQRQLRLSAEARNQEAMLEYLRRLTAAKSLADVHVASHQVQTEDSQHPVQFTVQALLKGAK
jgi:Tfp pilus assembly protein PilN